MCLRYGSFDLHVFKFSKIMTGKRTAIGMFSQLSLMIFKGIRRNLQVLLGRFFIVRF